MVDAEEIALNALGDQIQAILENSSYDALAFVLIGSNGGVEYRSQLDEATLREALKIIAEEF